MTEHRRVRTTSLIEQAAEVYDFMAFRTPAPDADPPPPGRAASSAVRPIDPERLREAGFIVPGEAISTIAEEFRIVKRQLLLGAVASPRDRLILVCSARPGDGKSFCAINLALSLAAERDVEVLLVDGDVAKPSILSTLGIEGGPGLMDAIADPATDVERFVIATDVAKLSVLPAGTQTHDDTEYLASARTAAVLGGLVASHPARIVILDSPPLLAASPASVLALNAGQALLVVRADVTSESDLREAVAMLSGCDEIKLMLNGVSPSASGPRFGDYYGFGS
jgi:exopolysaccharide/PEP-CTERM locus tyrosine autokinase